MPQCLSVLVEVLLKLPFLALPTISHYQARLHGWPFQGATYWGTVNRTKTGRMCLKWRILSEKTDISASLFPDLNIIEASNFCRNPGMEEMEPWCYVSMEPLIKEMCTIYDTDYKSCSLLDDGASYKGKRSITLSGRKCVDVKNKEFLGVTDKFDKGNFPSGFISKKLTSVFENDTERSTLERTCQNFGPTLKTSPWCYTDQQKLHWQYCDVCSSKPSVYFNLNNKNTINNSGILSQKVKIWNLKLPLDYVLTWGSSYKTSNEDTCVQFCNVLATCVACAYIPTRVNDIYQIEDSKISFKCFYFTNPREIYRYRKESNESDDQISLHARYCPHGDDVKILKLPNVICSGGKGINNASTYNRCKNTCIKYEKCQAFEYHKWTKESGKKERECKIYFESPQRCRKNLKLNGHLMVNENPSPKSEVDYDFKSDIMSKDKNDINSTKTPFNLPLSSTSTTAVRSKKDRSLKISTYVLIRCHSKIANRFKRKVDPLSIDEVDTFDTKHGGTTHKQRKVITHLRGTMPPNLTGFLVFIILALWTTSAIIATGYAAKRQLLDKDPKLEELDE